MPLPDRYVRHKYDPDATIYYLNDIHPPLPIRPTHQCPTCREVYKIQPYRLKNGWCIYRCAAHLPEYSTQTIAQQMPKSEHSSSFRGRVGFIPRQMYRSCRI